MQHYVIARGKLAILSCDKRNVLVISLIDGYSAFSDRNTDIVFYLHEPWDILDTKHSLQALSRQFKKLDCKLEESLNKRIDTLFGLPVKSTKNKNLLLDIFFSLGFHIITD